MQSNQQTNNIQAINDKSDEGSGLKFKVYCTIKPLNKESDTELFNTLKGKLTEEINSLTKNGYWNEPCKVYINDDSQEIFFGYPYALVEKLFPDTFCGSTQLDAKNKSSTYTINSLIKGACREHFNNHRKCVSQPPYKFQLNSRITDEWIKKKIIKLANQYECSKKYDWQEIAYKPEEEHLSLKTYTAIFGTPLKKKVVILGEHFHAKGRYLDLLCENIEQLKLLGVNVIALEGFLYKFHQKALNDYFESDQDELPIELSQCAIEGYIEPLKKIKKVGIRVIALDHLASIYAEILGGSKKERLSTFNAYAANIIHEEIVKGNICIALVGLGHGVDNRCGIVGLSCLLPDTISIGLDTPPMSGFNQMNEPLKSNYSFTNVGQGYRVHFFDTPLLEKEKRDIEKNQDKYGGASIKM